jgi:hypothetical protein
MVAAIATIADAVLAEEGQPPVGVCDFVQGIAAAARGRAHEDSRIDYKACANRLLESVQ